MMTCDDWKSFSHDYALGDLSDPARALLDRHVESCAACLNEARLLQLVDRRFREEPEVAAPAGLARRALEAAPARNRRELWRVAASLLLAGGIGAAAATGAFLDRLPEDVRSSPRVFTDAARLLPQLLTLSIKE